MVNQMVSFLHSTFKFSDRKLQFHVHVCKFDGVADWVSLRVFSYLEWPQIKLP